MMTVIDHVTYHLSPAGLDAIGRPMKILGFREATPDDPFEHGYDVRWFHPIHRLKPWVHFVATPEKPFHIDSLELGHFCVVVTPERYAKAATSEWCVRNSGSGRIWLKCDAVRIEVRPS